MAHVSRNFALRVIYWNAVAAVIVVCLGAVFAVRRVHRFDTLIVQCARELAVDPRLVSSVIWKESRFDPSAVGEAGEIGLMQVTEAAAFEWAEAEQVEHFENRLLFDPQVNVRAGTWYLGRAIQRWGDRPDPLPYALAEYNAGRNNALRWARDTDSVKEFMESITYPGTQRYIRDILKKFRGGV